ncbi:MAG TPA: PEP-CTERM sorting domain-containing protein, partial [Rariglobus sp.]
TSTSTGLAQGVGVEDTTPIGSGGNYLGATLLTKSSSGDTIKDSTSLTRAYDVAGGSLATASAVNISFDFRVDSIAAATMRYDLFENRTRATGATSASYNFRTSNGVWNYFNGEVFVATTMAFNAGTIYSFSIVLNPVSSTYTFTINNGTTSVSSSSDAAFRTSGFTTDTATGSDGGRWLTFNANESTNVLGQSTTFSVDNISISTIPEPSTYALLAGASLLGLAASRRHRAFSG